MISSKRSSPNDNELHARTTSIAAGVLYSFLLRILSFVLTQITLRFADAHTLGKASIRLELICSTTVLFLGREGFRLALVRGSSKSGDYVDNISHEKEEKLKILQANNVVWLSISTTLSLAVLALIYHVKTYEDQLYVENGSLREQQDYKLAGILFCIASAIEIISEPCMIICLKTMDVKTRAKAEGLASIGKALCCVVLVSFAGERYRVSSFGFAQCVYAVLVTVVLYRNKGSCLQWPSVVKNTVRGDHKTLSTVILMIKRNFDTTALRLSIYFSLQSIFKHILTEGDRIVLTALVGTYDSGVYAMASSYGGMASRLIFQPLEENGRLLFLHQHVAILEAREGGDATRELIEQLQKTYIVMVKCVLYIGLIFAVYGSNFTSILLHLLAGDRWGSNPDAAAALSSFCIYLSIMSLNGMTEAFVYGVAESGREVASLSIAHGVIGFVFYIIAPTMVIHGRNYGVGGTIGLVLSNGICMALRATYSFLFAGNYFCKYQDAKIKELRSNIISLRTVKKSFRLFMNTLPEVPVQLSLFLSFIVMKRSKERLLRASSFSAEAASHLGLGICCFAVTAAMAFFCERKNFGKSIQALSSRRGDKYKMK